MHAISIFHFHQKKLRKDFATTEDVEVQQCNIDKNFKIMNHFVNPHNPAKDNDTKGKLV